jgi:hypothetical protein
MIVVLFLFSAVLFLIANQLNAAAFKSLNDKIEIDHKNGKLNDLTLYQLSEKYSNDLRMSLSDYLFLHDTVLQIITGFGIVLFLVAALLPLPEAIAFFLLTVLTGKFICWWLLFLSHITKQRK